MIQKSFYKQKKQRQRFYAVSLLNGGITNAAERGGSTILIN